MHNRFLRSDPFLVLNGDTLLDIDYGRLLTKHSKARAMVTLALTQFRTAAATAM